MFYAVRICALRTGSLRSAGIVREDPGQASYMGSATAPWFHIDRTSWRLFKGVLSSPTRPRAMIADSRSQIAEAALIHEPSSMTQASRLFDIALLAAGSFVLSVISSVMYSEPKWCGAD